MRKPLRKVINRIEFFSETSGFFANELLECGHEIHVKLSDKTKRRRCRKCPDLGGRIMVIVKIPFSDRPMKCDDHRSAVAEFSIRLNNIDVFLCRDCAAKLEKSLSKMLQ